MKKILILSLSLIYLTNACMENKTAKAGYSGKDISNKVSVTRDSNTKKAVFSIDLTDKWKLYSGSSFETIDFAEAVLKGEQKGSFPLTPTDTTHQIYQLVSPEGNAVLAERHLPMAGGFNFRDMGRIKTKEGKYTKWGLVFRSDELNRLTDGDLEYLSSIPLISIVDFRSESEVEQAPDCNPESVKMNYKLFISPGNLSTSADILNLNEEQGDSIMQQINKMLVTDSASIMQYKKFFGLLQDESQTPLMFHCTAGKDRTGMVAALFLFSLGVEEETIFDDYLSSNIYLKDKYGSYIKQYPVLAPLLEVRETYLRAGINEINTHYGSVNNYLENILHVDIDKMKNLYLY